MKCQNIDQDRPKPSSMDFESMTPVQDFNKDLHRLYVGLSAEISKPLNEKISQLERESEEKDKKIANLTKLLYEKQDSGSTKERLYDF